MPKTSGFYEIKHPSIAELFEIKYFKSLSNITSEKWLTNNGACHLLSYF